MCTEELTTTKKKFILVYRKTHKIENGSHCVGGTKALKHWDCEKHKIIWYDVSKHKSQTTASTRAHLKEASYKHPQGYKNIKTAGI